MECTLFFLQDPLSTLERDLALQLQIAEAARCLSKEENLAKQVRKRRKSAVLKEEKKLKELEQALSDYRLASKQPSQLKTIAPALLEGKWNQSGAWLSISVQSLKFIHSCCLT